MDNSYCPILKSSTLFPSFFLKLERMSLFLGEAAAPDLAITVATPKARTCRCAVKKELQRFWNYPPSFLFPFILSLLGLTKSYEDKLYLAASQAAWRTGSSRPGCGSRSGVPQGKPCGALAGMVSAVAKSCTFMAPQRPLCMTQLPKAAEISAVCCCGGWVTSKKAEVSSVFRSPLSLSVQDGSGALPFFVSLFNPTLQTWLQCSEPQLIYRCLRWDNNMESRCWYIQKRLRPRWIICWQEFY